MYRISLRTVITVIAVVFAIIFLWAFIAGIGNFNSAAEAEQMTAMEDMINQALIQCYALEGGFPPNLEYLSSYGVSLNRNKYHYIYDVIGSNVVPDVRVMLK